MKLLLDTHLLLWAAADAAQLSNEARGLIDNREQFTLLQSRASASFATRALPYKLLITSVLYSSFLL
jgi:hypothetical protein